MRYQHDIEDEQGELVDVDIYCSAECFRAGTGSEPFGHYVPCPEMTDYRQYCPTCKCCTVATLGEGSFDSWPAAG